MSKISRTALENVALSHGSSKGQAKKVAASIVARDDWEWIQSVLTERFVFDYSDPTAHEAIWNVLTELLTRNHVGVAA